MTTTHARYLETGGREYRPLPGFTFTGKLPNSCRTGARNVHFHFHCPRVDRSFINPILQYRLSMSEIRTIEIEDRTDRWRFVCPRGHRSWEPTNHHFWCAKCARLQGIDGVFHQLRDRKTGMLYDRTDVQLLTPLGPYDRDLDQEGRV